MIKDRDCLRCKKITTQEIHMHISRSGAEGFAWRCQTCRFWTAKKGGGIWIPVEELRSFKVEIEALPVICDLGERCAVCGKRGTELHHWFPQAINQELADKFPKDWLCVEHHREWHDALQAAGLILRRTVDR